MKKIRRRNIRRDRRRRKNRALIVTVILALILGVFAFLFLFFCVKREAVIEYGEKIDGNIFNRFGVGNVTTDIGDGKVLTPGEYDIVSSFGPLRYKCLLKVFDTTSPVVTLKEISMGYGKELGPEDFVESIVELSQYGISYYDAPNWNLLRAPQTVSIMVKDEWGNQTVKDTTLLIEDYPEIVDVELGTSLDGINAILTEFFGEISSFDILEDDIKKTGVIPVKLTCLDRDYSIEINIVDTILPELKVRNIIAPVGFETDPKVLVEEVSDLSPVEISYKNAPDFSTEGTFEIFISAKDSSGNETVMPANITLIKDDEAPVFSYARDFDSFIGENIIFREKIKVTDNCTQDVDLKIDAGSVNINEKGEYTVTYTARDLAGNESSVTLKVNIRDKTEEEKELSTKIKGIIDRIITDGMSKSEQAEAIYYYVYNHITYVSRPKQDHVKAALEAINGRGGCFNYASLAMFLFDELGIKNMFMETNVHYWNIIDIDDGHGWYHFDCTPSPETPKIFLWTDAQMMDYSNRQNRTHHYDRSKYPVIP